MVYGHGGKEKITSQFSRTANAAADFHVIMQMKIIPVNKIFSQKNIDTSITLQKFRRLRKNANVDIEKYIYRERYLHYNHAPEAD